MKTCLQPVSSHVQITARENIILLTFKTYLILKFKGITVITYYFSVNKYNLDNLFELKKNTLQVRTFILDAVSKCQGLIQGICKGVEYKYKKRLSSTWNSIWLFGVADQRTLAQTIGRWSLTYFCKVL